MKRITLSIFFFLLIPVCFTQNSKTDSLLHILNTSNVDTEKVNVLDQLFSLLEYTDDKKAKQFLNTALLLSDKAGDQKGKAATYINLGFSAEDSGDYAEALKNYSKALKLFISLRDPEGFANAYNYMGIIYFTQGNYPEALKNYRASLEMRIASGNQRGAANAYNNIGIVYEDLGNYSEALKNDLASLKIREAINDKAGIASSNNNIGNVYDAMGDHTRALENHRASQKIYEALNDQNGIAACYENIGINYREEGRYTEALQNYSLALKIKEELGDKAGAATTYNNIGVVYFERAEKEIQLPAQQEDLSLALKNYRSSLEIREAMGEKSGIAACYANIANAYKKQKNYKDALFFLLKARNISQEIGHKEYLKGIYQSLTELDSANGDFKNAYTHSKLYDLYRDSLDNEETKKKTIQSQLTYEFDKKEAVAVAEHRKELENQQLLASEKHRKQMAILLLVSLALLLVAVFAIYILRSLRTTRQQKHIIEKQKEQVEEKQKEILDSIYYARRIQRSLLPPEKYIDSSMKRLHKNIYK